MATSADTLTLVKTTAHHTVLRNGVRVGRVLHARTPFELARVPAGECFIACDLDGNPLASGRSAKTAARRAFAR